jgi:hypothetical protein
MKKITSGSVIFTALPPLQFHTYIFRETSKSCDKAIPVTANGGRCDCWLLMSEKK